MIESTADSNIFYSVFLDQHYTWNRVQSTVHNVIVGNLWVDQHGESDVINVTTGSTCRLTFYPYSYFSRQTQRRVRSLIRLVAMLTH
jgi:Oxysterol-binding protein.